jgi:cyclophilin family peptidyl-prolyl cis-trans isomerase/HEAT repeat protein
VCLVAGLLALPARDAQQVPPQRPPRAVPLEVLRQMAQPIGAEPIEVLNVEKGWGGADALLPLTQSEDARVRTAAFRALGRLEDPRLVLPLLSLKNISSSARSEAVAQSLKGFDPSVDPRLIQTALDWLYVTADKTLDFKTIGEPAAMMMPLGRIRYATPEQMRKAESMILRITVFVRPDLRLAGLYERGLRALESLARVNNRMSPLEEETVAELKKTIEKQSANDSARDAPLARFYALGALIHGRGLDGDTLKVALKDLDWQVRRLATTVLTGSGAGLDEEARTSLIQDGLADKVASVRYEAVRAYGRHAARTQGCGPFLELISDADPHVSLAAMDALGDHCKEDDEVTGRVLAEVRTPPASGSWHRETHAFVALAKRSPEKAATSMEAFANHPVWWVRMYSAGAAAVAGDLVHLEKLAYDSNDNVREAAIEPLRRLKKADAEPAIVAALERTDVQLLRTAALLLKDSPPTPRLFRPLVTALMRLTKEGKETSRDARLALLDAIAIHANREDASELTPLLQDFDAKVAERAAQVMIGGTGRVALPAPKEPTRGWPQEFNDLRQCVVVQMESGRSFQMRMQPAVAPIAVDRFLKLATKDSYYNGLTFHRVVPNFVIQGGSPGANEYAGHKEYMRDEVGGRNTRGSVGLSTRGRNTGDAQFFINLVDNPRLDYDYTVFATVTDTGMEVVDKIQEGDVMRSINISKCPTQ